MFAISVRTADGYKDEADRQHRNSRQHIHLRSSHYRSPHGPRNQIFGMSAIRANPEKMRLCEARGALRGEFCQMAISELTVTLAPPTGGAFNFCLGEMT